MHFYWVHIVYTCSLVTDNKVQYRLLNSDISAYYFHIENGIVEEMMSLTFLMYLHFYILVCSNTHNARSG